MLVPATEQATGLPVAAGAAGGGLAAPPVAGAAAPPAVLSFEGQGVMSRAATGPGIGGGGEAAATRVAEETRSAVAALAAATSAADARADARAAADAEARAALQEALTSMAARATELEARLARAEADAAASAWAVKAHAGELRALRERVGEAPGGGGGSTAQALASPRAAGAGAEWRGAVEAVAGLLGALAEKVARLEEAVEGRARRPSMPVRAWVDASMLVEADEGAGGASPGAGSSRRSSARELLLEDRADAVHPRAPGEGAAAPVLPPLASPAPAALAAAAAGAAAQAGAAAGGPLCNGGMSGGEAATGGSDARGGRGGKGPKKWGRAAAAAAAPVPAWRAAAAIANARVAREVAMSFGRVPDPPPRPGPCNTCGRPSGMRAHAVACGSCGLPHCAEHCAREAVVAHAGGILRRVCTACADALAAGAAVMAAAATAAAAAKGE